MQANLNTEHDEIWDIYDAQCRMTGRQMRRSQPVAPGDYHLAVDCWITDGSRWLIQLRAPEKKILPNIWAAHGGSALAGEDGLAACLREVQEETGLAIPPQAPRLLRRMVLTDTIWDVYVMHSTATLADTRPQPGEVAALRWASAAEVWQMVADGRFFPYPELAEVLALNGRDSATLGLDMMAAMAASQQQSALLCGSGQLRFGQNIVAVMQTAGEVRLLRWVPYNNLPSDSLLCDSLLCNGPSTLDALMRMHPENNQAWVMTAQGISQLHAWQSPNG